MKRGYSPATIRRCRKPWCSRTAASARAWSMSSCWRLHLVGVTESTIQAVVDAVIREVERGIEHHRPGGLTGLLEVAAAWRRGQLVRDRPGEKRGRGPSRSRVPGRSSRAAPSAFSTARGGRPAVASQLVGEEVELAGHVELVGREKAGAVVDELVPPALDTIGQMGCSVELRALNGGQRDLGQEVETDIGVFIFTCGEIGQVLESWRDKRRGVDIGHLRESSTTRVWGPIDLQVDGFWRAVIVNRPDTGGGPPVASRELEPPDLEVNNLVTMMLNFSGKKGLRAMRGGR